MSEAENNRPNTPAEKLSKEMAKELVDMIADVEREEAESVSSGGSSESKEASA